jgi:hypothetical protein
MDFYVMFPVAIVGIFCNILSLAVLSRDDTMNPTTSLMLRQLAAADLLNILFIIPVTFMWNLQGSETYNNIVTPLLYYIFFPLQGMSFTASVWIEVFLTGERYVAICYPLRINQISTIRRVRIAVSVVWIVAVSLNLPIFFEQAITIEGSVIKYTNWLYNNPAYNITLYAVGFPIISMFLPFSFLVFFTTRMLTELRYAFHEKLKLAAADEVKVRKLASKQRRTTLTLVLIVVIFCITQVATFLNYIFFSVVLSITNNSMIYVINAGLVGFATFSGVLQSTLNFFVFCLTGQRFRAILREALGCQE